MAVDHVPGKQYPEQYRKDTADFVMASGRTIEVYRFFGHPMER